MTRWGIIITENGIELRLAEDKLIILHTDTETLCCVGTGYENLNIRAAVLKIFEIYQLNSKNKG